MIKRIKLKHYRGIDPNYSFCSKGFCFKKNRQISQEEFDIMTKNGLKGKESWASFMDPYK